MEFETGGCRDVSAIIVGIIILLIAVGAGVAVMELDDSATTRAELKSNAVKAVAEYKYQGIEAQQRGETQRNYDTLSHELAMLRQEQANYEQRLSFLAVTLAALNEQDEERLLSALEQAGLVKVPLLTKLTRAAPTVIGIAMIAAMLAIAGLIVVRRYQELMDTLQ